MHLQYRVTDSSGGYVDHVACPECLPNWSWLQDMIKAGTLTVLTWTDAPCEYCGDDQKRMRIPKTDSPAYS